MCPLDFFDRYPLFYQTSKTGSSSNRLNQRYRSLIQNNQEILRGASILDLASHDGRWSFAALKSEATKVTGIEGREGLVRHGLKNMEEYGIPRERYHFTCGDVFQELDSLQPGSFDVVFCFGFFYHIMNHMLFLTKIQRLRPRYLVIDTRDLVRVSVVAKSIAL